MNLAEAKEIWDKKYPRFGLSTKGSDAIDWLIAEVERLTCGFVDGVYMGACYCQHGHMCMPCRIRKRIIVKRLTAERDRYKAVYLAAKGLTTGGDWNNGTHAKIYRPQLINAVDAVLSAEVDS